MIITIKNGVNNASLQIGDDVYFVSQITETGGISYAPDSNPQDTNKPQKVGKVSGISSDAITVDDLAGPTPASGDFIMFSKNKNANNTSLIGYYAEVKLKNESLKDAELFSLNSEITVSSK